MSRPWWIQWEWSLVLNCVTALLQALTNPDLRTFEPWRKVSAALGVGVGLSVLLQGGLPGARSADSLNLKSPHIMQLVYHLSCSQPRPHSEIRESKCGYERITACAGCVSPLSVTVDYQGFGRQTLVSLILWNDTGYKTIINSNIILIELLVSLVGHC